MDMITVIIIGIGIVLTLMIGVIVALNLQRRKVTQIVTEDNNGIMKTKSNDFMFYIACCMEKYERTVLMTYNVGINSVNDKI